MLHTGTTLLQTPHDDASALVHDTQHVINGILGSCAHMRCGPVSEEAPPAQGSYAIDLDSDDGRLDEVDIDTVRIFKPTTPVQLINLAHVRDTLQNKVQHIAAELPHQITALTHDMVQVLLYIDDGVGRVCARLADSLRTLVHVFHVHVGEPLRVGVPRYAIAIGSAFRMTVSKDTRNPVSAMEWVSKKVSPPANLPVYEPVYESPTDLQNLEAPTPVSVVPDMGLSEAGLEHTSTEWLVLCRLVVQNVYTTLKNGHVDSK